MKDRTIHGVIFDQDGLLFDTERLSAEAWDMAGDELGFHLQESFLCTIRGANAQDAARRAAALINNGSFHMDDMIS